MVPPPFRHEPPLLHPSCSSTELLPREPNIVGRDPPEGIARRRDALARAAFGQGDVQIVEPHRVLEELRLHVLHRRRRRAAEHLARDRMAERLGRVDRHPCTFAVAVLQAPQVRRLTSHSLISRLLQRMSDGPSVPLAPPPSFPLSDLTNTIFFSCGSVRYLAVATCPIISLSLPVRRTIDVGLSASSSLSLLLFLLSSLNPSIRRATRATRFLWIALAISSLPVPVSPRMRTVASEHVLTEDPQQKFCPGNPPRCARFHHREESREGDPGAPGPADHWPSRRACAAYRCWRRRPLAGRRARVAASAALTAAGQVCAYALISPCAAGGTPLPRSAGRRRRSRQNANAPSNSVDDLQQNRLRKFGRQVSNEGADAGQKALPIRNQGGQHGIASKPRGQDASQRT